LESDGLAISVRALGAARAPVAIQEGAAFYAGAFPNATLVHVPLADGTEEMIELGEAPAERTFRWELTLGKAAFGVRVVAGVVGVLDAKGNPHVHTPAPIVVDADGHSTRGS